MGKLLVTGVLGQIGSELYQALVNRYGIDNVIGVDVKSEVECSEIGSMNYNTVDVLDFFKLRKVVFDYDVEIIFHLAAILSAVAEKNPQLAWKININGLYNILEIAREKKCAVFFPSSIGVFGPHTPKVNTPQITIQRPITVYGITKLTGELLCDYYFNKHNVDTRGLRFPGLISYKTLPGGGTTDYGVFMYYAAIRDGKYRCYLRGNTRLDVMYMPDAIRAIIELMEADSDKLVNRNAYNIAAMSVTPEDIANSIKRKINEFEVTYKVDKQRQNIADSWPDSIDDTAAREEWGWKPRYDLDAMTDDMLEKISKKLKMEGSNVPR